MLNRCSGKQGRGCSRFLAEWDNHLLCHSCRDCSQDNPCDVCSVWSTLTWSKSIKAISKLSRRANLVKTGEVVQSEGASRESSRPLQEGNEAPVVTDLTVSDVEVPSSLALTAGSNLGAPLSECSTAGNGTGNSSQSMCRRESEGDSGNQQPRPSQSPLRRLAVRHDDRVHGSRSRSRRAHRSPSSCTYRLPRAYRSRSRGKGRSAIRSRSRGRYRSVSTAKNRRSRSCFRSISRSSSGSFSSHGSRPRRGHSRRSRRSHSRRSGRVHRSHRGHRSRSKTTSRRSRHRSRRSRSHGRRQVTHSPSVSSGSSHPSLEPKRRLRFQNESNLPPNTTSGSAVSITASQSSTCDSNVHGVQPDMRNLIRQILSEELRSTTACRKRSRSPSEEEDRDRRVRRNSPSLSNPSNVDKSSQSTYNTDSTEIGDRGQRAKSPVVIASTDNISSVIQEPEILLRPEPGEKIDDSDDESCDHEIEESDILVQPSQLSYVEALGSLRSRLGPQLCPEVTQPEPQSGASALDFFSMKSTESVQPVLPQSRLILEQISKINSKIQGPNPILGSPLDSYPKGMGTNRFPSLMMKPKVFGQDSYRIADPTLHLNPPPIDPSFREVLRQGASFPTSHNIQLSHLEIWEKLARAGIHVTSHADMFLYGILSALKSSTPSQSDLAEVRRYLEALAQSHMHLFDVLVRLASGPLLARRDAYLDKCALESSIKASLRVQPLESTTLFGSKTPEVVKCYKEDLTRRSLQRAAASQSLPKKKKKTGAKSEDTKLVINSSESGQRQVISKPASSTQAPQQVSYPNRFRKPKGKRNKNQK